MKTNTFHENHLMFHPILFLSIFFIVGISIRIYFFPNEIPVLLDALDYFSYAEAMSQVGHFPEGWALANNGWPTFMSIFFSILNLDNFLDHVYLQRTLSLVISAATVFPMYLLSRRFYEKTYSLIVASLFIFEPRIITNSLLGITEPLYLILGIITLFLFFSTNKKIIYISFVTAALFPIIRNEGLILIIPLSIMFFVRFRNERRIILKCIAVLSIFLLVLIPVAYMRTQASGEDGLISHYLAGGKYVSESLVDGTSSDEPWVIKNENNVPAFIISGFSNLGKTLGWLLIPYFIFLVPIGLFLILKNGFPDKIDYKITTLILVSIALLLPAFYAYGRHIEETRFLFMLLPIFCLLSIPIIKKIQIKFNKPKTIIVLLLAGIIFSSYLFIEGKQNDYEHERDAFEIAKNVISVAGGVNGFYPESRYLKSAEISKNWPNIPLPTKDGHITREIVMISSSDFHSLEKLIEMSKDKGLTHLVVDEKAEGVRQTFLRDVFYNEEEYPYLEKIYDSLDQGLIYHVKIFKINYNLFEKLDI